MATNDQQHGDTYTFHRLDQKFLIERNVLEFRDRVIPKERFVEYEPSDLEWMIPLGMAPRIEIPVSVAARALKSFRDWERALLSDVHNINPASFSNLIDPKKNRLKWPE